MKLEARRDGYEGKLSFPDMPLLPALIRSHKRQAKGPSMRSTTEMMHKTKFSHKAA